MYSHHIPDRQIKEALKFAKVTKGHEDILNGLRPDAIMRLATDHYMLVEYESSSRGMVYHASSYLDLALMFPDLSYTVLFIRSRHHQETHKRDFDGARAIARTAKKARLCLFFEVFNCTGRIEDVVDCVERHPREDYMPEGAVEQLKLLAL